MLLAAAVLLRDGEPGRRWALTMVALVASLAGDVFLMLRRERFVAGLASFLLAHLAYTAAFATVRPDAPSHAVGAGVLAVGGALYARLLAGMRAGGATAYAAPVGVYVVAIAAMATSAFLPLARPGWDPAHAISAAAGGALFMTSDALIGWSRFVAERPWSKLGIIVTYHVAQGLLVLGLLG